MRVPLIAGVCAALLVSGCGVVAQEQPVSQPSLMRGAPTSGSETPSSNGDSIPQPRTATIYLVSERGLVPVQRTVDGRDLNAVILALVAGPNALEQRQGLSGLIQLADLVAFELTSERVVRLSVAEQFASLPATEQRLAIAQVVLTVADSDVASSVSVEQDGVPIVLPDEEGQPRSGPVSVADVSDLIAPSQP